jgi:ectoine hydroxylase-related dioxygenase (phytanoyl-CoA dioxygenase family)
MLTDFTAENGATLVAPGSHLATDPVAAYESDVVPAVAPAGTVMLIDGRVLHRVGASNTDEPRIGILNYYCRPFLRTQENYCLSLLPEVYAECTDELKGLLGFKAWNTFGGVDGHHHGLLASMRPSVTGEMSMADEPLTAAAPG